MSKALYEIEGFEELQRKLKQLPDKVKRREVVKILRRSARDTVKEARNQAPKSKKAHTIKGGKRFEPGNLKKSIGIQVARRSQNPMIFVKPRSARMTDGYYGRAFVIPGHKTRGSGRRVSPNPFMKRALDITESRVSDASVKGVEDYIQKQINRL